MKLQDNKCALCKTPFSDKIKPNVDHCHSTEKIRGILCNKCNSGLGFLGDNIESLERAINYLRY